MKSKKDKELLQRVRVFQSSVNPSSAFIIMQIPVPYWPPDILLSPNWEKLFKCQDKSSLAIICLIFNPVCVVMD